MTLLTETTLPDEIRYPGAIALLWHDILEDTQLPLPANAHFTIKSLVQEMTFTSLDEEFEHVWQRSNTTKLLKLYDKVSQFLDGTWLSNERWNKLVQHTRKLETFALTHYGDLNIIRISRAVCQPRTINT
jgi:hypothetical protein